MKKPITVVCVVFLTLIIVFHADDGIADVKPGAVTVTPFAGGYFFEGDQNLDHGPLYGLGMGYQFDDHWAGEAVCYFIDTDEYDLPWKKDVDAYALRLDALYHFNGYKDLVPYAAAGIGGMAVNDDPGGHDESFLFNYGGGVKYFLTDNVALRGDIRHILTSHSHVACTLGVTISFGGKKRSTTAAAPRPAREPRQARQEYTMADTIDFNVEFDFDKATIKDVFFDRFPEVIDFLKKHPDVIMVIEGHTDSVGDADYNMDLSRRRADSVMQYFMDNYSLPAERMTAKGYGETRPIATNDTEAGRAKNRRVVGVFNSTSD